MSIAAADAEVTGSNDPRNWTETEITILQHRYYVLDEGR